MSFEEKKAIAWYVVGIIRTLENCDDPEFVDLVVSSIQSADATSLLKLMES